MLYSKTICFSALSKHNYLFMYLFVYYMYKLARFFTGKISCVFLFLFLYFSKVNFCFYKPHRKKGSRGGHCQWSIHSKELCPGRHQGFRGRVLRHSAAMAGECWALGYTFDATCMSHKKKKKIHGDFTAI